MKKIFYLLILGAAYFICLHNVLAQDTIVKKKIPPLRRFESHVIFKDTFTFTTVRNDPENAPNFNVLLDPAGIELYGLNINMGYEASLHYSIKNKIAFWALYRGSYLELVDKNTVDQNNSIGGPATGLTSLKNAEVGGEFNFASIKGPYDETISLGRFSGYTINRTMTAEYLQNIGIRLGVQYFETYMSGDDITFSGYYINDPTRKIVNFGAEQIGTMMQENIINLGVSSINTHDLLVSNQTLGQRRTLYRTYFYGDIMYAPAISYTNVIVKGQNDLSREDYTDFNINSSTPKSRVGFRLGFTYYDLSSPGGTFSIETGIRPGPIFISGLYFMLKFGISLNAKI